MKAVTFDDGILKIYETTNEAEPGNKPVVGLKYKDRYYFGYAELGITRIYTAMQGKERVDAVVNVPGWNDIKATDICELEGGEQYKIGPVQPTYDEDGLKIMKLSLERLEKKYAVKT